jgi:hypothetical protein
MFAVRRVLRRFIFFLEKKSSMSLASGIILISIPLWNIKKGLKL